MLAGCSATVGIEPPQPDPQVAAACAEMTAQLPTRLLDQRAIATEPESDLTAAWGDPAITLACGAPAPAGLGPASPLTTVEGIDWYAEELTRGYRFTTVGLVAFVRVEVPDAYSPEVDPLVELAPALGTLATAPAG